MRIAQISPLIESVPPRLYGGTERVVSYLTEELVAQGHEVTLFASGDSMTNARLVPCSSVALRLDSTAHDPIPHYMIMLDKVMRRAASFDILHFHIDHLQFPLLRGGKLPAVTTLHGRQDMPDSAQFYSHFRDTPLISISEAQRAPIKQAQFVGTVHHGLPLDLYAPSAEAKGDYLAFLGRISPEKDPVQAIRIARAANMKLKIAAKVDVVDEAYFREQVNPLLDAPGRRVYRRAWRKQKGRVPAERPRVAVSDLLAGTVRPGDDRSHGLRHAGARLRSWLGARGCRRRRQRTRRHQFRGGRAGLAASRWARPARGAAPLRATLLGAAHGPGLCGRSIRSR